MSFFKHSDIIWDKSKEYHASSHFIYKKVSHSSSGEVFFCKLNKHHNPTLSFFEAAFARLFQLLTMPYLTPNIKLIKQDEAILGVASEDYAGVAYKRENKGARFFSLRCEGKKIEAQTREFNKGDNPIYFLNEFSSDFFSNLYKLTQANEDWEIDFEALASLLCSAYTLEEDDLHRGNLGFYVVERKGKKTVVFFKLDHDYMMAESILSQVRSRVMNWRYHDQAFKISAKDLLQFPKIEESKNYYWPTTKRYFGNNVDAKMYGDLEINEFSNIAKDPAFQKAKWRSLLKHVLISNVLIEKSLAEIINKNDPQERASIALLSQAMAARLSRLKAVLLSIPEFRVYLNEAQGKEDLIEEILFSIEDGHTMKKEIETALDKLSSLVTPQHINNGDTPLHVAIRLGDYRYHETWAYFKEFANQPNAEGLTPLDIAMQLAVKALESPQVVKSDVRSDPFFILHHLLSQGVKPTPFYSAQAVEYASLASLESYRFKTPYLNQAEEAKITEDFIAVLRDLGEDHSFSLKMKKEISIFCLRNFLANLADNQRETTVVALKKALNGSSEAPPRPELQYIRQLRSTLWIVRIVRGLFGLTSTQQEFNDVLNKFKKTLVVPVSFFVNPSQASRNKANTSSTIESNQKADKKL